MNILKKVAETSGIDPDTIKIVYYDLIKAITSDLRSKGKSDAVDLGEFRITEYKSRTIGNVNTGVRHTLPPTKVLKFRVCKKLRDYIKMMD